VILSTAIITAPRPTPTLAQSYASYRAAGFGNEVFVFAEDGADVAMSDVRVVVNKPKLGNLRNWVMALRSIYERTEAAWLMVCEDDITWAAKSAPALAKDLALFSVGANQWRTPVGGLSLYLPIRISKKRERTKGRIPNGWHHEGLQFGSSSWGAQCMVFTRAQAGLLLNDRLLFRYINDPRWNKNVDAIIGDCIHHAGKTILYRVPCLVDHVLGDANSSLGYKPDRPELRTNYFTGVA